MIAKANQAVNIEIPPLPITVRFDSKMICDLPYITPDSYIEPISEIQNRVCDEILQACGAIAAEPHSNATTVVMVSFWDENSDLRPEDDNDEDEYESLILRFAVNVSESYDADGNHRCKCTIFPVSYSQQLPVNVVNTYLDILEALGSI